MGHAALVPSVLEGAAEALAVDGNQLAPGAFDPGRHPGRAAPLEGFRGQAGKDPSEGVVGGDAPRQVQEGRKPLELGPAILCHGGPAVGPADHRTEGDDQHVAELVNRVAAPGVDPGP